MLLNKASLESSTFSSFSLVMDWKINTLFPLGILVSLHVAVNSELLHLVWVLVTLLSLQDCVSLLFITGGVIPNKEGEEAQNCCGVIILNPTLNSVFMEFS